MRPIVRCSRRPVRCRRRRLPWPSSTRRRARSGSCSPSASPSATSWPGVSPTRRRAEEIQSTLARIAAADEALRAARAADAAARAEVGRLRTAAERGRRPRGRGSRQLLVDARPGRSPRPTVGHRRPRCRLEGARAVGRRRASPTRAPSGPRRSTGAPTPCTNVTNASTCSWPTPPGWGSNPVPSRRCATAASRPRPPLASVTTSSHASWRRPPRSASERDALDERRQVHELLAEQLGARGFEAWLLDEALDALLEGASTWLEQLSSGRYAMAVDDKKQFAVIDHANADERRIARTLSGGETFLASLALALALAERVERARGHRAAARSTRSSSTRGSAPSTPTPSTSWRPRSRSSVPPAAWSGSSRTSPSWPSGFRCASRSPSRPARARFGGSTHDRSDGSSEQRGRQHMKYVVEQWAPEYGASAEGSDLAESQSTVDVSLELPAPGVAPVGPGRLDGRARASWPSSTGSGGSRPRSGSGRRRAGSHGAVRQLRRRSRALQRRGHRRRRPGPAEPVLPTGLPSCRSRPVTAGSASDRWPATHPTRSRSRLQSAMGELEHHVSTGVPDDCLLIVDGPLRERRLMEHAVGFVKRQHVGYLPCGRVRHRRRAHRRATDPRVPHRRAVPPMVVVPVPARRAVPHLGVGGAVRGESRSHDRRGPCARRRLRAGRCPGSRPRPTRIAGRRRTCTRSPASSASSAAASVILACSTGRCARRPEPL